MNQKQEEEEEEEEKDLVEKKPHEVETVDLSGPGEEGSLDRDSSNNAEEDRYTADDNQYENTQRQIELSEMRDKTF